MSGRYPEWETEGRDWPNRAASRFVEADGYRWHVQETGPAGNPKGDSDPPICLLIHGTGASTHSWRGLMPLLAQKYCVVAMDLPGHGFTRPNHSRNVTLPEMARSIGLLVNQFGEEPHVIVGHSAGAALGAELLLQNGWTMPLIGLNPALLPFPGLAARIFPTLAKVLFTNPFVSIIFARMASAPGAVERFLSNATGSRIDGAGARYYKQLFRRSGHCDGAIRMMANWRLEDLRSRLPDLLSRVLLIHGERDKAIPGSAVSKAASLIPNCELEQLPGLGHLAHEENPEQIAELITAFANQA